jgi:hypothetical protein
MSSSCEIRVRRRAAQAIEQAGHFGPAAIDRPSRSANAHMQQSMVSEPIRGGAKDREAPKTGASFGPDKQGGRGQRAKPSVRRNMSDVANGIEPSKTRTKNAARYFDVKNVPEPDHSWRISIRVRSLVMQLLPEH